MVQIWKRCKPLQLIRPVNTDHVMFIWKIKPVLSSSKKLSRYQNSKILLSLNAIALSNSCMFIRSLQVWHGLEFQLKGIGRNMRCKLLHKRSTGKSTGCSKHLQHIAIEKDTFSELNRCIFQISLKYIKLVIPKILFILVFWNFNFYSILIFNFSSGC